MGWIDGILRNVLPAFVVMSLLAIVLVRRDGLWRGIGAAWLATFVVGLAIAVLYPNSWSLDCGWLNLIRSGVGQVTAINPSQPCGAENNLPLGLVALPPLVGIVVLVAWIWRHTRPSPAAMQTIAIVFGCAIVAVLLGQLNESLALLFVVAVAAAAYAWPRLQRQHAA